jgi:hypothetical protein
MKTLTISVAEDVYQRASKKAAAAHTSLPEVVQGLISNWTQEPDSNCTTPDHQRRANFLRFLEELAARPVKPGPSVGPLNREELYERGVSRH